MMNNDDTTTTDSIILSALSTLSSSQLSSLSVSLSTTFNRHHHQLATLVSSPTLLTHTLNHLYSLSLHDKSLLIARHLLLFLRLLTPFLFPSSPPTFTSYTANDLDSVLLLLFLCEVQPTLLEAESIANWQEIGSDTMLNINNNNHNILSGYAESLILSPFQVLGSYVDLVVKCRRFINSKGCGGGGRREQVAASVEAVFALPSVESGGGVECVICKEDMQQGTDVCELPCQHKFHWKCMLPWLSKRNACPCCRFLLPTDHVYGEIQRLWDAIAKLGMHLNSNNAY